MMNDAVVIQNDRLRINFLRIYMTHIHCNLLDAFFIHLIHLCIHYAIENILLLLRYLYKTFVTLKWISITYYVRLLDFNKFSKLGNFADPRFSSRKLTIKRFHIYDNSIAQRDSLCRIYLKKRVHCKRKSTYARHTGHANSPQNRHNRPLLLLVSLKFLLPLLLFLLSLTL